MGGRAAGRGGRCQRAPVPAHVCDQIPAQRARPVELAELAGALDDGDGEDVPGAGTSGSGEES